MRNGKASITRSGENSKVVRLQQPKEMFHTDSLANQNVPYYNPCSLLQFGNIKRLKKQKKHTGFVIFTKAACRIR